MNDAKEGASWAGRAESANQYENLRATGWRRPAATVLRVPLLWKLVGTNALLFATAVATHHFMFPDTWLPARVWAILVVSLAATAALVWYALRPIAALEAVAERVSGGDFAARVPTSPLSDRQLQRLAVTMNRLLARVETDRARIQYLAGRSVRARDIERETVARELRDSFAQVVAAAALQLAAAQRVNNNPEVEQQLERARSLISQLTEDMRGVAQTLSPGTLSEFGLVNALHALARRTNRRSTVRVEVDAELFSAALGGQASSALYRVADEALRNVAQHSGANHARVLLRSEGKDVFLDVEDDGRGVDMRHNDPFQAGLGLFSAKAVLALAGGEVQILSAPGVGTRVAARAHAGSPIQTAPVSKQGQL